MNQGRGRERRWRAAKGHRRSECDWHSHAWSSQLNRCVIPPICTVSALSDFPGGTGELALKVPGDWDCRQGVLSRKKVNAHALLPDKDRLHCRRFLHLGSGAWLEGRQSERPTANSYIFEQQKYSSRPIWSALSVAPAGGYASPQLSARYRNNGWKWGAKRGDEWGRHLTGWELHSCWSGPSQRVVFANDTLLKNAGQSKHAGAPRERRSSAANSVDSIISNGVTVSL